MPNYEYKCEKCENIQEELHSFKDTPIIKCNECGTVCKKIISAISFSISGESWSKGPKMKKEMLEKNSKMQKKMSERTDGVRNLGDLKKRG